MIRAVLAAPFQLGGVLIVLTFGTLGAALMRLGERIQGPS